MQNKNKYDNLERKVRDKLSNLEYAPPNSAWNNISEHTKVSPKSRWKKALPMLILFFLSGASWVTQTVIQKDKNDYSYIYDQPVEVFKPTQSRQKKAKPHVLGNSIEEQPNTKKELEGTTHDTIFRTETISETSSIIEEKKVESEKKPEIELSVSEKSSAITKLMVRKPANRKKLVREKLPEKNENLPGSEVENNDKRVTLADREILALNPVGINISLNKPLLKNLFIPSHANKKTTQAKKWTPTLEVSPSYSFMRNSDNTQNQIIDNPNQARKITTRSLGVSSAFGVEKQVGSKLHLNFAVKYTLMRKQFSFESKPINVASVDAFSNFFDPDEPSKAPLGSFDTGQNITVSEQATFHFIGLRAGMEWSVFPNKQNQSLRAELGVDVLLYSKFTHKSPLVLSGNREVNPSVSLGYEWRKEFGKGNEIGFGPTVSYYLSSVLTENSTVEAKPILVGLGIRLHFGEKNTLE